MTRWLLAVLLASMILAMPLTPPAEGAAEGDVPEQLQLALSANSSEMLVTWITADHSEGGVQWGLSSTELLQSSSGTDHTYDADGWSGVIHDAAMTGLAPGTEYHYRVGDDVKGWSPVTSFTTAPDGDGSVRIGVVGDMDETDAARDVVAAMSTADLDLVLFAGDLSYAYDATRFWDEVDGDEWDQWGRIYESVSSGTPTMFAVGNHENEERDGCEGCGYEAYLNRVNMPFLQSGSDSEFWYSFNFSLFHIVVISSEQDYSYGSAQYQWLESDLAAANSDREAHPWLLALQHRPMYSSSESGHGSEIELRFSLEPLLVEHGVDIVFSGHDHDYERTFPVNATQPSQTDTSAYLDPEAPIHLVIGTGGRILYPSSSSEPDWSAQFDSTTHGYGVLELLDRDAVQFTFIDDDDEVVRDAFTIGRGKVVQPVSSTPSSSIGGFSVLLVATVAAMLVGTVYLLFWRRRTLICSRSTSEHDEVDG